MKFSIVVFIFLVGPSIASAATTFPKTFKCNYQKGVFTTNSVSDRDKLKSEWANDKMELIFDNIDIVKHTARLIGNAGTGDIVVKAGDESLHLLESTMSGNINITTIYIRLTSDGSLLSVHSRHTGNAAAPTISQYWGSCKKFD